MVGQVLICLYSYRLSSKKGALEAPFFILLRTVFCGHSLTVFVLSE